MTISQSQWIQHNTLEEILQERDQYSINSEKWLELNEIKALWLEHRKPSIRENIITFTEKDLEDMPLGFISATDLPNIPFTVMKRSLLEHHPLMRHPIPYIIVRYEDKYFFILREQGSGEIRLIGKVGMLGGHISEEDVVEQSLSQTVYASMLRELYEEAGITEQMIISNQLKGIIRSNEGVDADHLGLIYEIAINTDQIKAEEEGVLSSIWIQKDELLQHVDRFESWSKIVYEHIWNKK